MRRNRLDDEQGSWPTQSRRDLQRMKDLWDGMPLADAAVQIVVGVLLGGIAATGIYGLYVLLAAYGPGALTAFVTTQLTRWLGVSFAAGALGTAVTQLSDGIGIAWNANGDPNEIEKAREKIKNGSAALLAVARARGLLEAKKPAVQADGPEAVAGVGASGQVLDLVGSANEGYRLPSATTESGGEWVAPLSPSPAAAPAAAGWGWAASVARSIEDALMEIRLPDGRVLRVAGGSPEDRTPAFTQEQKLRIVAESLADGDFASVAKEYGTSRAVISQWREELGEMLAAVPRAFTLEERQAIFRTLEGKTGQDYRKAVAKALLDYGVTPAMIDQWRRGWFTNLEKEMMVAEAGDGDLVGVAKKYGISRSALNWFAKTRGALTARSVKPTFTVEQKRAILEEADRENVEDVAIQHGTSYRQIYRWRKELGWTPPARGEKLFSNAKKIEILREADNEADDSVGMRHGISAHAIRTWRSHLNWPKPPPRFTTEQKLQILREVDESADLGHVTRIAEKYNIDRSKIYGWRKELGWEPRYLRAQYNNKFTDELKLQILREVDEGPVAPVLEKYGVSYPSIWKWRRELWWGDPTQQKIPTEQKLEILREADVEPVEKVAQRHGVGVSTIYLWRRDLGWTSSKPRAKQFTELQRFEILQRVAETGDIADIAGELGISPTTIYRWRKELAWPQLGNVSDRERARDPEPSE